MKDKRYCKAIATWKSGRIEEFKDNLKKDGTTPKRFNDRVKAYREFPTVVKVEVVTF